MNLVRLIYASRFCEGKFDTKELSRINHSSQKNNKISELTGILVFGDDFFLQCLEGDREEVSKTYHRISQDPRHESVVILSMEDAIRREFSEWDMKCVILTEANNNLIREFSTTSKFHPHKMHHKNSLELMKALRK